MYKYFVTYFEVYSQSIVMYASIKLEKITGLFLLLLLNRFKNNLTVQQYVREILTIVFTIYGTRTE